MNSSAPTSPRLAKITQLFSAALMGGAITAAAAYLTAMVVPWLFRTDGVFPYTVPELIVQDVSTIAAGSALLAIPISLVFGVPILFSTFRWASRPVAVSSVLGGSIGPIILGGTFAGSGPLPYGNGAILISVALLGLVGAFASASILATRFGFSGKHSAA